MNHEVLRWRAPSAASVCLVHGDITEERVDAIVNAANSQLQHGGGVAAAIVRRGGESIQRESDAIGAVPVGAAVVTGAGSLPCRFVVHAVGPRWGEGDEDAKLERAASSALRLAASMGLRTVSMPAISSGIFGFPRDRCARILLNCAREWLCGADRGTLEEIRLCVFDAGTVQAFELVWGEVFGPASPGTR